MGCNDTCSDIKVSSWAGCIFAVILRRVSRLGPQISIHPKPRLCKMVALPKGSKKLWKLRNNGWQGEREWVCRKRQRLRQQNRNIVELRQMITRFCSIVMLRFVEIGWKGFFYLQRLETRSCWLGIKTTIVSFYNSMFYNCTPSHIRRVQCE